MAPRRVLLAIITHQDELSLVCTTSLLRLQQVAGRRDDVLLDVHLVPTFLDALNTYSKGDYVFIVDGTIGVPPEFVFNAIASDHDVVAGVYPLPKVDWDRVAKVLGDAASTEPLNHAGNTYNVTPAPGRSGVSRYVPVREVKELKVLCLKSSVLEKLAGPETSYDKGHLFTYDSVFDNAFSNVYQTLARKLGIESIMADLDCPCVCAGPAQFAGCVGMRGSIR
jgi:hypothetical protein